MPEAEPIANQNFHDRRARDAVDIVWEGVVKSTRTYIERSPQTVLDSELLDDLVLSYMHWKDMCVKARVAYDGWRHCATLARPDAYAAFCSALQREERAAAHYERVVDRIERMPSAR